MSKVLSMSVYVGGDGTLYQMLPDDLCGPDEGCCCKYCKAQRENGLSPSTWNCLAVNADSEFTWTVHMPRASIRSRLEDESLNMAKRKR